jgi:hypothetical protein
LRKSKHLRISKIKIWVLDELHQLLQEEEEEKEEKEEEEEREEREEELRNVILLVDANNHQWDSPNAILDD